MDFDRMRDLAGDPRFIPGIYNYCDRWCERCPKAHRCLTYACQLAEKADADQRASESAAESHAEGNERFWQELQSSLDANNEALEASAGLGDDTEIDAEEFAKFEEQYERRRQMIQRHPLSQISRAYLDRMHEVLLELDTLIEEQKKKLEAADNDESDEPAKQIVDLDDCLEVIGWYHTLMHVKLHRALMSVGDEAEEGDMELPSFPKDSDGSAKIVLIGIDRSLAAWNRLSLLLVGTLDDAVLHAATQQLRHMRVLTDSTFPNAKAFVRPGLDE
ncbi:MAG: hypothetical protein H7A55_17720 [Verrucomicrobiaceae bacterium]|nr:hypothetical protein [Verrucomicrobiaceae bacterium]